MLDERSPKHDAIALALVALTVFLGLALGTYDPADPPSALVHPPRAETDNICGWVGAHVAHGLFTALGLGAYYTLVSMAAWAARWVAHRPASEPLLRFAGWMLSLLGVSTLAALVAPGWSPGPVIGSGGYLGAAAKGWLELHVASAGAYLLSGSLILGGLLLSTDYWLVRMLGRVVAAPLQLAIDHAPRRRAKPRFTDMDDDEELDARPLTIRKPPKLREPVADADDDEEPELDEEASPDAEEASETAESEGLASRVASALRIKHPAPASERDAVRLQLEAAIGSQPSGNYELPSLDLLLESEPFSFEEHEKEVRRRARVLEKTFLNFGFNVQVVEVETGPVITQYELQLEAGLRLSKIMSLGDDVAIALKVPSVRIVAPIPGKNTVGIEVPNTDRQLVRLREVIEQSVSKTQKMGIPFYLGKDVSGNPLVVDLTTLPHLLIAGRTGTGKSVCLNALIMSMLMTRRPDEVRMLLIDPKMVELSPYMRLPHLMHPVVTDMKKAEAILAWAVEKMEERYALLARAGVRHISSYNQLGRDELRERLQPESEEEAAQIPTHLPYIVIVADEMADLMMTAAKEVESHIIRLAQKSRAVGIHLVLATQKPTVDVITGLIKSNLPARISFQVSSRVDSRVVLDEMGADKLLGNGDMLFLWPGTSKILRGQGAFVSDDEVNRVVARVGTTEPQFVKELVALRPAGDDDSSKMEQVRKRDELYEAAVDIVVREGRGSVSLLQRALGIGYGRAARLIDFMMEDGFVGQYAGSQAREVLITIEDWETMQSSTSESPKPSGRKVTMHGGHAQPDSVGASRALKPATQPAAKPSPATSVPPWEVVGGEEEEEYDEAPDDDVDEESADDDIDEAEADDDGWDDPEGDEDSES